ncbi:trimethylguanosine synthase [Achlya hypogyna]|uniref:Trimethylguanosine synthase n=1 Tax=Achlya hypogyna TaxID=1202772 RepID=A0A1V9YZS2_ACHHY|nr:trimethylguanosine synthase [Achlya hypogyna]
MAITFRNVYLETADLRRRSMKKRKKTRSRRKRPRIEQPCEADVEREEEARALQAQLHEEMEDAGLAGMLPLSFGSSKKFEAAKRQAKHVKFDDIGNETLVELQPIVLKKRPRDEEDSEDEVEADDVVDAAATTESETTETETVRESPAALAMEATMDPSLAKYWAQRYALFTKFDDGIRLDHEGWFSVTPEVISEHHARRIACDVVVDAFTGCGGNAIQLAKTCRQVIAIDMDPAKIEIAKHNAGIYGVADRIEWLVGDAFELLPTLRADVVFLSPPWGGPEYLQAKTFELASMRMGSANGIDLFHLARRVTHDIVYFLPRNTCKKEMRLLAPEETCEFEHNFLNKKLKTVTVYFGALACSLDKQTSDPGHTHTPEEAVETDDVPILVS